MRLEAQRLESGAEQKAREEINQEAGRHTKRWTAGVASQAQIDVRNLLRDDDLADLLSVRSEEFNRLIRNLSQDVRNRIERQTLGAIFEGRGNAAIAKSLQEIGGIGRNRARLIARDQASKLSASMNQFRQQQAGVTHFKWKTILDGRERPEHNARNGKVYPWSKPPEGGPGVPINCRCRALAVLTDDPDELANLPGADEPLGDFFEANLPIIREIAPTPSQPVFALAQNVIAERLVMTREVTANVAAAKATRTFTEANAERLVVELYGFMLSPSDIDGLMSGTVTKLIASRRTKLIAAAAARLELIETLLRNAALEAD